MGSSLGRNPGEHRRYDGDNERREHGECDRAVCLQHLLGLAECRSTMAKKVKKKVEEGLGTGDLQQ